MEQYYFKPQEDITTYELAMILQLLIMRDNYDRTREIGNLPPEFKRHFKVI